MKGIPYLTLSIGSTANVLVDGDPLVDSTDHCCIQIEISDPDVLNVMSNDPNKANNKCASMYNYMFTCISEGLSSVLFTAGIPGNIQILKCSIIRY